MILLEGIREGFGLVGITVVMMGLGISRILCSIYVS